MKKTFCLIAVAGIISSCTPVVLGGAAAGATFASQERTVGTTIDDTNIASAVRYNFAQFDAGLLADIGVEVNRGRVLLTGLVNAQDTVELASRKAEQVVGVTGVVNEIQLRNGQTNIAQDSWITSKIRSKMLITKGLHSMDMSTETVNGVVYIFGTAQNLEERNKTINIARNIAGVRKVVSHVDVKG